MSLGGRICDYLKAIRKVIADKNGIKYEPEHCPNSEGCSGSCPHCDKEAQDMLDELNKKREAGQPVDDSVSEAEIAGVKFKDGTFISNAPENKEFIRQGTTWELKMDKPEEIKPNFQTLGSVPKRLRGMVDPDIINSPKNIEMRRRAFETPVDFSNLFGIQGDVQIEAVPELTGKVKLSSIDDIKEVRRLTGCGLALAKKALLENNNDIDKAVEWVKKRPNRPMMGRTTTD